LLLIFRKQAVGQQSIIASSTPVSVTTGQITTGEITTGPITTGPITTGAITTGALMPPTITVQEYCAGMPIDEGDQKFYCSADHLQFYQCLTGAFNSQSSIMNCPSGLQCNCAPGVACDPVCDYPPSP